MSGLIPHRPDARLCTIRSYDIDRLIESVDGVISAVAKVDRQFVHPLIEIRGRMDAVASVPGAIDIRESELHLWRAQLLLVGSKIGPGRARDTLRSAGDEIGRFLAASLAPVLPIGGTR